MNQIKLIRLERRIKARELAMKTGITPSYLCLIEKGRIPSIAVKRKLAKVLNLPIRMLWNKGFTGR